MATSGLLTYHACHSSGIMVSELGSGLYDHIGFFGAGGVNDAIIVNQYNDATFVVDASGAAGGGQLMNNKFISISGCSTSGQPSVDIVNYQNDAHLTSGTLQIWFRASPGLKIDTYNARLFVYDLVSDNYYTPPTYVNVVGFEINPSGATLSAYDVTEWSSMGGMSNGIEFFNHSPTFQYFNNQNEHLWRCAISARADAVGLLSDFNFLFTFQFA